MKRAFTALLTLMLCACLLLLSAALAEDLKPEPFMSGDYRYILLEDGTAEITGYNGEAAILVIPSPVSGMRRS